MLGATSKRRDNPGQKEFVSVIAVFTPDGRCEPIKIRLESTGQSICVRCDMKKTRPAASFRAGGHGIRYICTYETVSADERIVCHELALYHDGDYWFIEVDHGNIVPFEA